MYAAACQRAAPTSMSADGRSLAAGLALTPLRSGTVERRRRIVALIRNTIPDFQRFAARALSEEEGTRQHLWEELYRAAHPDVFTAFFAGHGSRDGVAPLVRRLRGLRARVQEAVSVLPQVIEEVEPLVRQTLQVPEPPAPLHVLMVGTFSANAFVDRLDEAVAVFHCLEWFSGLDPSRVLVAHEDTHAWHEIVLGTTLGHDPAWTAFAEGLAIEVSRTVVPGRPEEEYFWYGLAGFEDWLPWCRENRDLLRQRFRERLDDENAVEAFFGGGLVEDRWRVGFFLADELVRELGVPLPELVRMSVEEGRQALRSTLGA